MKIVTWNVNGLRKRQGELLDLIERERPDVVCVQEIKASIDQLPFHVNDELVDNPQRPLVIRSLHRLMQELGFCSLP